MGRLLVDTGEFKLSKGTAAGFLFAHLQEKGAVNVSLFW